MTDRDMPSGDVERQDYSDLLARLDVRQERGDVPEAAAAIRALLAALSAMPDRQAGKGHQPSCCCAECAKDWMDPTEIAFAIGEESYKRTGITPAMREVMQLRRDNLRGIADTLAEVEPAIEAARQAGINEGLEMAAKVAEGMGADRIERNEDGSLRSYDMNCKHQRGDAVLNAMRVRAQTIANAIRAMKVEK